MDALLGERPISFKALTDFSRLDAASKKHLKNVYASLAISLVSAAVGAGIHLLTDLFKVLSVFAGLGVIGFMLAIWCTSNEPKNQAKRLGYLVAMALCTGLSMGPLLDRIMEINPSIIVTAFFASAMIFVCFSLCALLAEERSFLYLGGSLMSGLLILTLTGVMNIFFRSQMVFNIYLYGGLVLFCGFILYDTQLIIEKRRTGDTDFVWHSVDLFLDFINIFRRIMIILANKEDRKKRKE